MGDAMTFICVLRLVSSWFPTRRIPLVTQLTGTLGQLGAVAAAIPMTWALSNLGWTRAYLVAASIGVLVAVAMLVVLWDAPGVKHLRGPALSLTAVRTSLSASWAHPGTRLGFWMHFSTQFSATALGLLWGYPFFVRGEGLSPAHCRRPADPHGRRRDGRGPGPGLAGRRPSVAPLDDGDHHRLHDRGRLDRGARLARATRRSGCWWCSPSWWVSVVRHR